MKKVALFVEGQTEAIFVSEMIRHIFGENETQIIAHNMQRMYYKITIDTFQTDGDRKYYFLIYNCGSDEKVKSSILDNYHKLQQSGFISIIGLQDLFNPQRKKKGIDDDRFQKSINDNLPQGIPIRIYFAVQEIEAWFIAEDTHYQRISSALTIDLVNSIAGINIQKDDTGKIAHPSVVLNKIYTAGGKKHGYSKNEYAVKSIVENIDIGNLYLSVRHRNSSLNELLVCLDGLYEERHIKERRT